jgi:phage-related protein
MSLEMFVAPEGTLAIRTYSGLLPARRSVFGGLCCWEYVHSDSHFTGTVMGNEGVGSVRETGELCGGVEVVVIT